MLSRTTIAWILAAAGLLGLSVHAQQNRQGRVTLTAFDRIQIQQLVAEAHHALHSGAEEGRLYASLFTADGASDAVRGTDALTAYAKGGRKGQRSLMTNVLIEPSAQGATGRQYEFGVNFVPGYVTEPVTLGKTGRYEDTYVKAPQGWRIKTRTYVPSVLTPEASKAIVPSKPSPSAAPAPAAPPQVLLTRPQPNAFSSTLTALDYLEIEQLVASYGHALDNGLGQDDNGAAYASLFAPDAVFGRPYTKGEEALKALARAQPHNRRFARHFLTNIVIEPAPGGAVGRQFLVVVDQGEGDKPSSVLLGGHYEDVYVKTPGGWKFKQRTLYPTRTGPQP
jgi:hypothetical protein